MTRFQNDVVCARSARPQTEQADLPRTQLRKRRFGNSAMRLAVLAAVVGAGLAASTARATTLYWDADYLSSNGVGTSFGSGTWDTPYVNLGGSNMGAADWYTGSTTVPDTRYSAINYLGLNVPSSPDVVFGGGDGTAYPYPGFGSYSITVGNVAANSLTFSNSGYSLTTGTITLGGTGSIAVNNAGNTYISAYLAGTSGLTVSSNTTGTLYLTQANTYTGTTLLQSGTTIINAANAAFGASTSNVLLGDNGGSADATLDIYGGNLGRNITVQSGAGARTLGLVAVQGATAAGTISYANRSFTGNIVLNKDVTFQSLANATLTFSTGVISGTGAVNIAAGSGRISFTGSNSVLGNINVNSGTFVINSDNALGNTGSALNNAVTMANNTALYVNAGAVATTRNYTVGSSVVWSKDNTAGEFKIGGTITDNGKGLTIIGGGMSAPANYFSLAGNNTSTFTGNLSLAGTSLRVYPLAGAGTSALGSTSGTVSMDNAWLEINNSVASGQSISKNGLTFAGLSTVSMTGTTAASMSITFASLTRSGAGIFMPTTGVAAGAVFDTNHATDAPINNTIVPVFIRTSASGDFMTYAASGFVTATYSAFVGNNATPVSWTDTSGSSVVNITTGAVKLDANVNVYALKTGFNIVDGTNSTLKISSGGLTLTGGTIGSTTSSALDFNNVEGIVGAYTGASAINSIIQGTNNNGLTVIGTQTLTLGGASSNTYTGTTTILNGVTLSLAKTGGATAVPGNVLVNLGGTLSNAAANQMSSANTTVTVAGTWNLNNYSESIYGLTLNNLTQNYGLARTGGSVAMGTTTTNALTIGAGGLTINAGGTITWAGTPTAGGITVNNAGAININAAAINGAVTQGSLTLGAATTLTTSTAGITLTGGLLTGSATSVILLNGGVTTNASPLNASITTAELKLNGADRTFTVANGDAVTDLTATAKISGNGNLIKDGPGRMDISGTAANLAWAGALVIKGGTLDMPGVNVPANITGITIDANHTSPTYDSVWYLDGWSNVTATQAITVQGTGAGNAVISSNTTDGNNKITGTITLNKDVVLNDTSFGSTLNISAVLQSSTKSIFKTGPGGVNLSGASPLYLGQITIKEGTLGIGSGSGAGGGTGSNAIILLGDTSGTADVMLNQIGDGITIPQGVTVQSGSSGVATIQANSNNGWTITGAVTLNKNVVLSNTANMTFNGAISGVGGITKIGTGTMTYTNLTAPTSSVVTDLNAGTLRWQYNQTTGGAASISFGAGNLVTNGGTFDISAHPTGGSAGVINLTNAVTVTSAGGGLTGSSNNANNTVTFGGASTGAVALGGMLSIGNSVNESTTTTNYAGTFTLDQTAGYNAGLIATANGTPNMQLTGTVQDGGTGAFAKPLILGTANGGNGGVANLQINTPAANMTYAGGTVIRPSANGLAIVNVGASSKLGTGNVFMMSGAIARFNAATNIYTAGGAALTAYSNQVDPSIVALGFNSAPSSLGSSFGSSGSFSGILAIDVAGYNAITDMSAIGNGAVFIGSVNGSGVLANTGYVPVTNPTPIAPGSSALTPGGTGGASAATFRLGGGGGTLNVTNNVLTGANNLIVGQVGTAAWGVANGGGTVKLNAVQGFTGTITVNGAYQNGGTYSMSVLESVVQANGGTSGANEPFGTGANNVFLNGGTLRFDMPTTARTDLTIGSLNLIGGPATLTTDNGYTGSTIKINGSTGIVRNFNAALSIQAPAIANLGSAGTKFLVANSISGSSTNAATYIGNVVPTGSASNGMVTVNGVVAPWITYTSLGGTPEGGDFLAYDATNGFVGTTYTVNNVAGRVLDGTTYKMSSTTSTDIVNFTNTGADATMAVSTTLYALRDSGKGGSIIAGGTNSTLTLTSGALSADAQNSSFTIGSATAGQQVNVVFGDGTTTEAVVYAGYYSGATSLTLNNVVSAGSLTKNGPGQLLLGNVTNSIPGQITINGGGVVTTNDAALGNGTGSNSILLNGGTWIVNKNATFTSSTMTHNIAIGPAGGGLILGTTETYAGSITDMASMPAGFSAGPLTINLTYASAAANVTFSNTTTGNNWSGGTLLTGPAGQRVTVASGVNFGTGDVTVQLGSLVLQGSTANRNNLGANAKLTLNAGTIAYFQGANPVLGALDGSGLVILGGVDDSANPGVYVGTDVNGNVINANADKHTTLTVGGNDASTVFDGAITDSIATRATAGVSLVSAQGYLTKVGAGNFTLNGVQTYSGLTTVNKGTLTVNGSLAYSSAVNITNLASDTPTLALNGFVGGPINVNSAGTLKGRGVAGGLVTVADSGTIAPGNSVGTLTLAAGLNMTGTTGSGANYDWELGKVSGVLTNGSGGDQIIVSGGNLALGGTSKFTVDLGLLAGADLPGTSVFWSANRLWKVIDVTGSATNTGLTNFINFANTTNAGSLTYSGVGAFSVVVGNVTNGLDLNDVYLQWTAQTVNRWADPGANWTTLGSWTLTTVPNAPAAVANLLGNTSGTATVNVDAAVTVGKIIFSNAQGNTNYTVSTSTSGSITMDNTGGTGNASIGAAYGTQVISVPIHLANTDLTIDNTSGNDLAISGGITTTSGAGNVTITDGSVLLSGTNTYSGQTHLTSNGTLKVGAPNATSSTSQVNLDTGTTLNLNTYSTVIGSLNGSGTVTIGGATLTAGGNGDTTAFSGAITGSGNLTKAGSGTLTLTGTPAFTGTYEASAGTLTINATLASSSTTQLDSTGTLAGTGTLGNFTATGGNWNGANTIVGTASVTAGTLNVGSGANLTAPTLNVSSTGTISATDATSTITGSINYTSSNPSTFAGFVAGAGKIVTMNSSGITLTLTGSTNSYTGGTNVQAGTLSFANGALGSSGVVTFTGNATLQWNGSNTQDISTGSRLALNDGVTGTIDTMANNVTLGTAIAFGAGGPTKSGALAKIGSGKLTLSAANTFTGGLIIKNGTVVAATVNTALGGTAGAGTVTLGDTTGANAASLLVSTTGLTYANPIVLATNSNFPTLTIGNTGTAISTTFSGGVTGTDNLTINENATTGTIAFTTVAINNAGTVTNTGAGSGTTTIGATGGIGSNVTGVTENSTTSALTISGALTVATGGTTLTNSNASGTSLFTVSGGVGGSGALVLNNNSAIANGITISTVAVNNTGTITNSGTGSGNTLISAVIGINVTGVNENSSTSALTLSGTNTYAGQITVTSGSVLMGSATTLSAANSVKVYSAGTFDLNANAETIAGLNDNSGSGGTVTNSGAAKTLTLGGSGTYSFAGVITAATPANLALTVALTGSGSQTLSGTNTYTGLTTVSSGTLKIGSTTALSTANAITTSGTGILDINGNASALGLVTNGATVTNTGSLATLTLGNGSTGAGSWSGNLNAIWNQTTSSTTLTGSWTNAGSITLNANGAGTLGLTTGTVNNTGTITNSGTSSGTATISGIIGTNVTQVIENSTTSILVLSGVNTYNGATTVTAGTLQLGNASALGSTVGGTTVAAGAVLDLAGQTIGAEGLTLNGTGVSSGGALVNTNAAAASLSGNVLLQTNSSIGGANAITLSGIISGGSNTLTKVGAGTLTFGGAASNTYTGLTTVSLGTLALNKTAATAIAGDILVNSGATLSNTASNQFATTSSVTVNGTWNLNANSDSVYSLTIGTASPNSGTVNLGTPNGETLTIGAGGFTVNAGGTLTATTPAGGTNTITVNGPINVAGSVYLAYQGNLTLTANNQIFLTGGALSSSDGNVSTHGVTLAYASSSSASPDVTTNASATSAYIGPVGGTAGGFLALNGATRYFSVADGAAVDDLIISSQITGTGNIVKTGPGQLNLAHNEFNTGGRNSYTGSLTVNGGKVVLGDTQANLTTITIDASNSYDSQLTINFPNNNSQSGAITVQGSGSGNAVIASMAPNNIALAGNVSLAKDLVLNSINVDSTLTLNGIVSGAYNISKIGPGPAFLNNAVTGNTFNGSITISEGSLKFTSGQGTVFAGTTSGSAASGQAVITLTSVAGLVVGNLVANGGVSVGRIGSINAAANQITLTGNLGSTVPDATALTFGGTMGQGTTTITLGSTSPASTGNVALWIENGEYQRAVNVPSGPTAGTVSIGNPDNNGNATLNASLTFNRSIILFNTNNTFTLKGALTDNSSSSSISVQGGATSAYANGTTAPSFGFVGNDVNVSGNSTLRWNYTQSGTPANATGLTFGLGTIVLNGGNFEFVTLNTTAGGPVSAAFTSPVTVTSTGGGLYTYAGVPNSNGTSNLLSVIASPVSLGGTLNTGTLSNNANSAVPRHFSGAVTLDQSTSGYRAMTVNNLNGDTYWDNSVVGATTYNFATADAAGAYLNPLAIRATTLGGMTNVSTDNANHAGSTLIEGSGAFNFTSTGSHAFGTGSIYMLAGTITRFNAATQVNTAGGASLNASGTQLNKSVVGLGGNFLPSTLGLNSDFSGGLAIDATGYNAITDFSTVGNGMVFFGSTGAAGTGTITNSSAITPGYDNLTNLNKNTYRLGGGGGTLTVSTNALSGNNSLIVGQVGGSIAAGGASFGVLNGGGTVKLAVPQTGLTGTVSINGGTTTGTGCCGAAVNTSVLELVLQHGTQPLGTGANTVILNAAALRLDTPTVAGGGATASIGDLNLLGGNSLLDHTNTTFGNTFTINGTNGIVRKNNATMQIAANNGLGNATNGTLILVGNTALNGGTVTNAPTAIGNANSANGSLGMVTVGGKPAPWILLSDGSGSGDGGGFVAYTAQGLVPTTYTVNGLVQNVDGTTNHTLNNTVATDIVQYQGVDADNSMTANHTIYAMHTFCCTSGRAAVITAGSGGPITLTVTSGGISIDQQGGNTTFGSTTAANAVNVKFGGTTAVDGITTEAVLWTAYFNGARTNLQFNNGVTASALTATGWGNVTLANAAATSAGTANAIAGPVTIAGGAVVTTNEYNLGDGTGTNQVVLNGGQWAANGGGTISAHNILMGPAGGILSINGATNYAASIGDLAGQPAGPLAIMVAGNNLTLSNTTSTNNLWSGGTVIQGNASTNQVIVQNNVNFGTGDVSVRSGALTLQGNSNLANTATVGVTLGAAANFQSATPTIGAIDGSGSVVLGNTTGPVSTNLTLAGSANTAFDGVISQAAGTTGSLTKTGSGTFTLANAQTFTGTTTISNGKFNLLGSLAGGAQVDTTGTLAGTGLVSGPVVVATAGTLSPGQGIGNLTLGSLTMSGTYQWELGTAGNDHLQVNGALNVTSLLSVKPVLKLVNVNGSALDPTGLTYTLIDYTGTLGASPSDWTIDNSQTTSTTVRRWTGGTAHTNTNWDGTNWGQQGWVGGTISYATSGKVLLRDLTLGDVPPANQAAPVPANDVVIALTGGNSVVTGPTAPTTINSLIIGDSGTHTHALTLVNGGPLTVSGLVTLKSNATLDASATTLTANRIVSAGTLTLGAANITTQDLTVTAGTTNLVGTNAGSLVVSNVSLLNTSGNTTVNLIQSTSAVQASYTGTTAVATGGTLTANTIRQDTLRVIGSGKVTLSESAGKLADGWPSGTDGAVSVIGNLSFDSTAKLDVTNNDLIITGMSAATVESMVRNGYSNGAWDGSSASPVAGDSAFGKIVSTDAALRNIFTLLVMDSGNSVSSFDTVTGIPAHSVIVKFTHEADLNGDGRVTGTGANNDLSLFASYYAAYNVDNGTSTQRAVTHAQGDMDFDGQLTFNDAMLFANYYNEGLAHLPEPTSLAFLALGAAGLLARKRK